MFTNIVFYMLLQNAVLIHTDIFQATYPGLKMQNSPYTELNPVANIFWQNNMWIPGYLLALSINYLFADRFLLVDRTGITSTAILGAIAVAELFSIQTWEDKSLKNLNIKVTAFAIQF